MQSSREIVRCVSIEEWQNMYTRERERIFFFSARTSFVKLYSIKCFFVLLFFFSLDIHMTDGYEIVQLVIRHFIKG